MEQRRVVVRKFLKSVWIAGAVLLTAGPVLAQAQAPAAGEAVVAPPAGSRILEETAALILRDNAKASVALRVPVALNRPANAFRLYGVRPMTLRDYGRRRDLYRDAFLELATRSRIAPPASAWDALGKQVEWLSSRSPNVVLLEPAAPSAGPADANLLGAALQQLRSAPGYGHLAAIGRALGVTKQGDLPVPTLAGPVGEALQLRALATDEAEKRLSMLGEALRLEDPSMDPAMREGYHAARLEFDQLRQGLWPALAATVRRHQGELLVSAVKEIVLSRLGFWAIFGYMGWQGVESALNTEYHGQYAICLATLAARLTEAAPGPTPASSTDAPLAPNPGRPHALYAELVLNYELTEALKAGQPMPFKPAGGRTTGSWQIQFSSRQDELKALVSR